MYRYGMFFSLSFFLIALGCASTNEVAKPAREVTPEKATEKVVIPTVQPVPQKSPDNGKVYVQEQKKVPSAQLKKIETTRATERDPATVISTAQKKAAQNPSSDRYINAITVYDYMEGALYQIYAATPGETGRNRKVHQCRYYMAILSHLFLSRQTSL